MLAIGCDHVGYPLKLKLMEHLEAQGIKCVDFGCHDETLAQYPLFGNQVAKAVAEGRCEKGLLICGTGAGMEIVANKVPGIRAVVCSDVYTAKMAAEHNNANVLTIGARVLGVELAKLIVDTWLTTPYDPRHDLRVNMITQLEQTGHLPHPDDFHL